MCCQQTRIMPSFLHLFSYPCACAWSGRGFRHPAPGLISAPAPNLLIKPSSSQLNGRVTLGLVMTKSTVLVILILECMSNPFSLCPGYPEPEHALQPSHRRSRHHTSRPANHQLSFNKKTLLHLPCCLRVLLFPLNLVLCNSGGAWSSLIKRA